MAPVDNVNFDVICEIAKHADNISLRSLNLLNHTWNDASNRVIWEKLTIKIIVVDPDLGLTPSQPSNTVIESIEVLKAVIREPERARHIRDLTLQIGITADTHSPVTSTDGATFMGHLSQALMLVSGLRTLRLRTWGPGFEGLVYQPLNAGNYPFGLHTFESDYETFQKSLPFISSQPLIRSLSIPYIFPRFTTFHPLHRSLLPRLESVAAPFVLLPSITEGRPIRSVDCSMGARISAQSVPYLLDGLRKSSVDITQISIELLQVEDEAGERPDDIALVEIFSSAAPRVRSIRFLSHYPFPEAHEMLSPVDEFPKPGLALNRLLRALGSFKDLRELEWKEVLTDDSIPKARRYWRWNFVDSCLQACPGLRKVVLDGDVMDQRRRRDKGW